MHIAITATFLHQPRVGSGQYVRGLLAELPKIAPQHRITLLVPGFVQPHTETPAHRTDAIYGVSTTRSIIVPTPFDTRNRQLAKLWFEQIGAPFAAKRIHADLLHIPYFAPPYYSTVPVVVSVLDLIPLLLPEYRGRLLVRLYTRLVAAATRNAAHVITISEASKRDSINHLHIPPERITVTPLAAGLQYQALDRTQARAEAAARYNLPQSFIYYVGGLDARKNVAMLIRAVAHMRRAGGPAVPLVIAGRALSGDPVLFPDLDAVIAAEGAQSWVRRIDVPPSDGPLLYAAAEVFAYPSRYEGFGLGPLEAMACGTPVIVSNASSLPEVVGDAALCVAPDDLEGWANNLRHVLSDQHLRMELRERGLARAATFNYTRTATQTLGVYETE
ncbi:MAG: glycosyltransferase family 1 protein [Roseiflexaceae bacterium]|nr:glycosyltransferase family 1 protein [Roseiflexaceae bacterium]